MAGYFADTSALAKLYIAEVGSAWLRSLDLQDLTVSALALPEMASALARIEREGLVDRRASARLWLRVRRDFAQWLLIHATDGVLRRAAAILRRSASTSLLTLDAIQLASALEANQRARRGSGMAIVMLTADERLEAAARRYGLAVDNPNQHP
jgi:predicted nucleic acid-binding protein